MADLTPRTAARLAGWSYVALFALGIFGNFFVRTQLVETGDADATFRNIADATGLVRVAILAFIAAFVLDVVVAWALHIVFRQVGASTSALAAWLRIVYTVFLGVAVVFLYAVLSLVSDAGHIVALDQPTREAHAVLALDAFNATWLVGLTCFGAHLGVLGIMILRTGLAPRWLGVALVAAATAYLLDTTAYTLLASYQDHESVFTAIVAIPAVIAEASLAWWLLKRDGHDASPHRAEVGLAAV